MDDFFNTLVGLTTLLQNGSEDSNRGRVTSLLETTIALATLVSLGATTAVVSVLSPVTLIDIAGAFVLCGGLIALPVPRGKANATVSPAPPLLESTLSE